MRPRKPVEDGLISGFQAVGVGVLLLDAEGLAAFPVEENEKLRAGRLFRRFVEQPPQQAQRRHERFSRFLARQLQQGGHAGARDLGLQRGQAGDEFIAVDELGIAREVYHQIVAQGQVGPLFAKQRRGLFRRQRREQVDQRTGPGKIGIFLDRVQKAPRAGQVTLRAKTHRQGNVTRTRKIRVPD